MIFVTWGSNSSCFTGFKVIFSRNVMFYCTIIYVLFVMKNKKHLFHCQIRTFTYIFRWRVQMFRRRQIFLVGLGLFVEVERRKLQWTPNDAGRYSGSLLLMTMFPVLFWRQPTKTVCPEFRERTRSKKQKKKQCVVRRGPHTGPHRTTPEIRF